MVKTSPRIFLSHAVADKADIIEPFLNALRLGCDLPSTSIFCSSAPANIPNGSLFVSEILHNLNASDLVIAVVSPAFLGSHFCLAEAGAAQLRRVAQGKPDSFFMLLVPPLTYDVGGVLHGVQSGFIHDTSKLDELFHRIQVLGGRSNVPNWNNSKLTFLQSIAKPLQRRLAVADLQSNLVMLRAGIEEPVLVFSHSRRFCVQFVNGTKSNLFIEEAHWLGGGIQRQDDWYSLRVHAFGSEETNLEVKPGQKFTVEVAIDTKPNSSEIALLTANRTLGKLMLKVRIEGMTVEFIREF